MSIKEFKFIFRISKLLIMREIHVTWEVYHKKIEQLARKVYQDKWKFNQVICIAKGGLRVGDVFSRLFNVPLAILSVESYHGNSDDIKNQQGQFTFSRDLAKTTPNLGSHVLLVDDLADSGKTLIKSVKWLELFYGFYLEEKFRTPGESSTLSSSSSDSSSLLFIVSSFATTILSTVSFSWSKSSDSISNALHSCCSVSK